MSFEAYFAGRTSKWVTNEVWTLHDNNTRLSVKQTTSSFRGKRSITAVYEKQINGPGNY